MSTRNTFFTKPTVEIDQDRYEELIRHEMQYEQYRQQMIQAYLEEKKARLFHKVQILSYF